VTLATIWGWLFSILMGLLALGWLWQFAQWLLYSRGLIDLNEIPQEKLPDLLDPSEGRPHLAVIVPGCNEEASIEVTLRSLLASREIRLQVIAVDDRSTDRTGQIMEQVRKQTGSDACELSGHTLEVLHIEELPPGWLGKPHALASAARLVRADWILFTDADVLFAPQSASLALRHAQAEQADHFVLMPDWTMETHGEAAMHGAMHALTTWAMRPWRVSDPTARDFIGVGAFNLVRRSTYEALGGFESLRMEVIEDLRFGWMLKRAGYRQRVALGPGLASVRWAQGAWGVVRNLEKNLFSLYRYRVGLTLLACFGLTIQILMPITAFWVGGWPRAEAIVLYAAVAGIYVVSRRVTQVAPAYVLVYPLAVSLFLFAMLRSMTLTLVRGGVVWRGTLYSLKDLRAHAGPMW
jgi:glycosyltransferase involved in cell wall biosynthesis